MANKRPRKSAEEAGNGTRLGDLAYSRILEALFSRKLEAGTFVSQADLVELTQMTVAPVRDALRVLEAEGIVVIHPRTGIQLVKPGMELTRATYQFRGIVETAAIATFAQTATDQEMSRMADRHRAVVSKIEKGGLTKPVLVELEHLEDLLHGSIVSSLENPLIDANYRRVRNYVRLIGLDRRLTPTLALKSMGEHLTIIEACRSRDIEASVNALKAHFSAALQRSIRLY